MDGREGYLVDFELKQWQHRGDDHWDGDGGERGGDWRHGLGFDDTMEEIMRREKVVNEIEERKKRKKSQYRALMDQMRKETEKGRLERGRRRKEREEKIRERVEKVKRRVRAQKKLERKVEELKGRGKGEGGGVNE
eukprot:TRINITY_DN5392_c0_g1_i2.p2 TRINITY_DN5392_c0_g1~~TRINITY_DN5392_c0_g1_i2.p2  ORF type:complete len:136 (-),score=28.83 TRINITY_DN5392_c0_g1_i2:117-524(-)